VVLPMYIYYKNTIRSCPKWEVTCGVGGHLLPATVDSPVCVRSVRSEIWSVMSSDLGVLYIWGYVQIFRSIAPVVTKCAVLQMQTMGDAL
jgi:hypothetical protein